jgi:hypothetical protein
MVSFLPPLTATQQLPLWKTLMVFTPLILLYAATKALL